MIFFVFMQIGSILVNETLFSVREYCLEVNDAGFNETQERDFDLMVCHELDLTKIYKIIFLSGKLIMT